MQFTRLHLVSHRNPLVQSENNLSHYAYRTYYRYDARGRVIKMWNVIDGLGTKIIEYIYNSANQVQTLTYQSGDANENNMFRYFYDDAGRLEKVQAYDPGTEQTTDFCAYTYNQNSQVSDQQMNLNTFPVSYSYNNRNWLTDINAGDGTMDYA